MNPFEPPRRDRRQRPEPLGIRLLALGMVGIGAWSARLGLGHLHRIGYVELAFAAVCFGLGWITWYRP